MCAPSSLDSALCHAIPERQALDAPVDDGAQPLDRPRELEPFQAREQATEDRFDLDARDLRAHAEVLAESEREMGVRAAIDTKRERVLEHVLVAIRGREVERQLIARPD